MIDGNTPTTEPSVQATETPTLNDQLETEKPTTNHDIPEVKDLLWRTPASFYWTRDRETKKPVLAYHQWKVPYLADAALVDENSLEDFCIVFKDDSENGGADDADTPTGEIDSEASKKLYGTTVQIVRDLIKNDKDMVRSLKVYDQSDWEANTHIRNIEQAAAMAAIETVYWKDERAQHIVKLKNGKKDVEHDNWAKSLDGFVANSIRRYYLYSQRAIALSKDGQLSFLPKTKLNGKTGAMEKEPGIPPALLNAARSFLAMRAKSEQNRMLKAVESADQATALKSESALAVDPQAAARAALMDKYKTQAA